MTQDIPNNIDKRYLWKFVNKKINRAVKGYHVVSIINILFEEMLSDLRSGKEIEIFNFGKLFLKKMNPRKYHDVRYNRVMVSHGGRILKFILSPKIKRKICQALDIDKTLKGDYE